MLVARLAGALGWPRRPAKCVLHGRWALLPAPRLPAPLHCLRCHAAAVPAGPLLGATLPPILSLPPPPPPSPLALPTLQVWGEKWAGKTLRIRNPDSGKTMEVTIYDTCDDAE